MKEVSRGTLVLVSLALVVSTVRAADPAYVGKWKFNRQKAL